MGFFNKRVNRKSHDFYNGEYFHFLIRNQMIQLSCKHYKSVGILSIGENNFVAIIIGRLQQPFMVLIINYKK